MTTKNMSLADLQDLVEGLTLHPGLWREALVPRPGERQFSLIARTERVEVWAVAWMAGQDTGFHDHDASAAAITVYEGEVVDERMAIGSDSIANTHAVGSSFNVGAGEIHRVRHTGEVPAITLHAYSPPLDRMGAYEVRSDGRLLRTPLEGSEALSAG
jgi:quercetin dioxygenase-like cupin family protein